ncbi:MAG: 5-oxoprolinase subunit PxpB [Halothiobacillaceae bacterium]
MAAWRVPEITAAGLDGLMLRYPEPVGESLLAQLQATAKSLRARPDYREVVPGYATIYLRLSDPAVTQAEAGNRLRERLAALHAGALPELASGRLHELPVRYGGRDGPDLERVAAQSGLSSAEVIERHAGQTYRVYAVGFMPGFAYLGLVDRAIAVPRLETPRSRVPAGSVALADRQTAVYPAASPGGWNLIGHCALPLFERRAMRGLLGHADRVRFVPAGRG